jgi:hypothetical protein
MSSCYTMLWSWTKSEVTDDTRYKHQKTRFQLQHLKHIVVSLFFKNFWLGIHHTLFRFPLCMCTEQALFPYCHVSLV